MENTSDSQSETRAVKVRKVSVKELFGVFDHSIPMNLPERITIIHGPNGFGKTAILRLLSAVFNRRDSVLRRIPYEEFRVDFDDSSALVVHQQARAEPENRRKPVEASLVFEFIHGESSRKHTLAPRDSDERALEVVERIVPHLDRIARQAWRDMRTGEVLDVNEVLDEYGDDLPPLTRRTTHELPDWLVKARSLVPIQIIEAQRLVAMRPRPTVQRTLVEPSKSASVVEQDRLELVALIQKRLAEYATLSQSLDRTFPTRLVRPTSPVQRTDAELVSKLRELESKRARLAAAGLLGKGEEDALRLPPQVDETNRKVLSVYADDAEQKLAILDDLLGKIEVLQRTINDHFSFKKLKIDQDRGYMFSTANGKDLLPADLSSGEQHELVLNHELLFRVKPHSLILIDEPELSFHVAWQEAFLKDLDVITHLADLDVLIATHSPQIIHDRWDLTVNLKAPPSLTPSAPTED